MVGYLKRILSSIFSYRLASDTKAGTNTEETDRIGQHSKPTDKHVRSSDLGIPPAIYVIVYEMDLFSSRNTFLGTSTEIALYEYQGRALATPVDRRCDEEYKFWYLRRVRETINFDKPLARLTAREVHSAFFPDAKLEEEFFPDQMFERRPALFYESPLEKILGDTSRRKNEIFETIQ